MFTCVGCRKRDRNRRVDGRSAAPSVSRSKKSRRDTYTVEREDDIGHDDRLATLMFHYRHDVFEDLSLC